ncbi:transposase [Gemmata sp. JC717]|uniref:IS701 family transposase n=1 Tax=Gemmata algarum TaxID=2975278 RepID=UPI0021BB7343|nr:transposase [Gemmata algarum]MDY3557395.1 transposase [Gemmata algarum]
MAKALDPRSAPRLAALFLGLILARGRRTVSSWIRAAQLSDQYRRCYATVAAVGRRTERVAMLVLLELIKPLVADGPRVILALDDTPTERYGPHVEGAGVHHNPTPGPAGSPFVYGHVWVVLGLLVAHPLGGIVALPVLARLYIRKKDLGAIDAKYRPAFATKLVMAVDLVRWAHSWLKLWGKAVWVVADGAYAKAPVLKPLLVLGVTVVSRLRKDAALCSVPPARKAGTRGRTRVYGEHRVSLAKRAGQPGGWVAGTFDRYGKPTEKRYKTFVATWRPAGGAIRVVLVDEPTGWVAFFCTDTEATVANVLGLVADRFSLETCFRDLKQVVGAGHQQVRGVAANVGCFHLCLWALTMTEVWAWDQKAEDLVAHRSASPWDDRTRRPSHADKRRAWQRVLLAEEIQAVVGEHHDPAKIQELARRCLDLAA